MLIKYKKCLIFTSFLFSFIFVGFVANATWDTAKFRINHGPPTTVDVLLHFDRPLPENKIKVLVGEGRPGTNVQKIQTTKLLGDPNNFDNNMMTVNGQDKVHIISKNNLTAGMYPLKIGGTYIPATWGKIKPGQKLISLPNWDETSTATVAGGDLIIDSIVRDLDLPDSVSPTKTYDVPVTFSAALAGTTVTFSIDNGSMDNGIATIVGGNTLANTGTITVKGVDMTKIGHDTNLVLVGKVGAVEKGRSPGFSVCAHASEVKMGPGHQAISNALLNGQRWFGMQIDYECTSDSGTLADLDKVQVKELVSLTHTHAGSYQNLPSFGSTTSGWKVGTFQSHDSHAQDKASIINLHDNGGGSGSITRDQVFIFYCKRCGMEEHGAVVVEKSGYQIKKEIISKPGNKIDFKVTKTAVQASVDGFGAKKGPSASQDETVNVR